ncbi:hypothetical protein SAMN05446927_4593 [Caballeronia arationis]|uniref:Uncharacterized protein n=2 Tax=Caballeronia arationis TaxID=1777142 RepID=A0A7Z7I8K6_9BURK|nr:hypothetical protein SAMN05446927_4593 [Caballeronia arationis]
MVDENENEDAAEFFLERAAIMEIDGGLSQADAEFYAAVATRRWCLQRGIPEPNLPRYLLVTRLSRISETAIADGIDRETLMRIFLRHAGELSANYPGPSTLTLSRSSEAPSWKIWLGTETSI